VSKATSEGIARPEIERVLRDVEWVGSLVGLAKWRSEETNRCAPCKPENGTGLFWPDKKEPCEIGCGTAIIARKYREKYRRSWFLSSRSSSSDFPTPALAKATLKSLA
jgi:hypothetical protein